VVLHQQRVLTPPACVCVCVWRVVACLAGCTSRYNLVPAIPSCRVWPAQLLLDVAGCRKLLVPPALMRGAVHKPSLASAGLGSCAQPPSTTASSKPQLAQAPCHHKSCSGANALPCDASDLLTRRLVSDRTILRCVPRKFRARLVPHTTHTCKALPQPPMPL